MPYRVVILAVFPCLVVVILNVGAASAGQASKAGSGAKTASSKSWVTPRLPDGRPDLQGVWDFRTATPLERPLEFAQQEFLTDENVVAVERRAAERLRVQRPDEQLLNTAPWWLDFGTHVVGTGRSSLIVDPADGRVPPMTPAGLKRQTDLVTSRASADGPEGLTSWDRCITRGLPEAMLPTAYNNNLQLVQTPGYVVIITEMIHEARIVPVDGRSQLPQEVRAWNGSSRGRWEGDTLIVETTNFSEKSHFRGASGNLHLTERFSRLDADTIDYRFTVDDPSTWTAAWTVAVPLVETTDLIYEYACHEANYSLENMLRIARADEAAKALRP